MTPDAPVAEALTLTPIDRPFVATIAPPGSKSLTNRALVLAALADGRCRLSHVLLADDTRVMLDGLRAMGFELAVDETARTVAVEGRGGAIPESTAEVFCGNSGTTIRFLAALCCLGQGVYTFDGVPRMRQRPIADLVQLLRAAGAAVEYLQNEGYPPIRIRASGLSGATLAYDSAVSSQYLSALLMASPYARQEVRVNLSPRQTSWPYVAMTMRLMDHFGLTPELLRDRGSGDPKQIVVPQGRYAATDYSIEPDASNAAYFFAAAAVHPGATATIEGLGAASLQGDVGVANVLGRMGAQLDMDSGRIRVTGTGALCGIDVDLRDMPDQAQTLAVVALFARGQTILRGLHTLRVKETDRLAALGNELRKLGAAVAIDGDDTLMIDPPPHPHGNVRIATYDDHRMAMSFAVAGTKLPGIGIENPGCVNKTYPEFFRDLRAALHG